MNIWKTAGTMLLALAVAACGGGGGSGAFGGGDGSGGLGGGSGSGTGSGSGSGSGTGSGTGGGGTGTSAPILTVSMSSNMVTPAAPAKVTIALKDAQGAAAAGKVVALSTVGGLGTLPLTTVLTDAKGIATADLQARTNGASGADELVARATVDGVAAQGSVGFQVSVTSPTLNASVSPGTTVRASSPVTFRVTVRDAQGSAVPAGLPVVFSVSNSLIALERQSALTDSTGSAEVRVSAPDAGANGTAQVVATAVVDGVTVSGAAYVGIAGEQPALALRLSSSNVTVSEPALVSATVTKADGTPAAGTTVSFTTTTGMGQLTPTSAVTDTAGVARTSLTPADGSVVGVGIVTAQAAVLGATTPTRFEVVRFGAQPAAQPPTLNLTLSSTTTSLSVPVRASVTVRDAAGQGVPGLLVEFATQRTAVSKPFPATARTDTLGQAWVWLLPADNVTKGADVVSVRTSTAGFELQASQTFDVQATPVAITSFTADSTGTLSAYAQQPLTVRLSGASPGTPVSVTLGSTCLTAGKATISPAVVNATSTTFTVQYRDNGCGVQQDSDRVLATITGAASTTQALDIPLARPDAASIGFVSALPGTIYLKGSPLATSARVTFEVRDRQGNALPNESVQLSLLQPPAGLTMEGGTAPVTLPTGSNGQVSVRIDSGTVPGPVRVQARVVASGVQTVSSALGVATGLPTQLGFSLAQTAPNIEGYSLDGTTNTYTVIVSDRSGNPVPAGTTVNFITTSGQIETVRNVALVQGAGQASARFVSASPRPADGRFTVLAYAQGEESFIDLNGNNVWDAGEPFQDLGSLFVDRNFDGLYDTAIEERPALGTPGSSACAVVSDPAAAALLDRGISTPSVAGTCDGTWSPTSFVRRAIQTVLSTSTSDPVWVPGGEPAVAGSVVALRTGPGAGTSTFRRVAGSSLTGAASGSFAFLLRDANGVRLNPMAFGTTVAASGTEGLTVTVLGGSPVAASSEATSAAVRYQLADGKDSGTISLAITSPSGTTTVVQVSVSR